MKMQSVYRCKMFESKLFTANPKFARETRENKCRENVFTGHFEGFGYTPSDMGKEGQFHLLMDKFRASHWRPRTHFGISMGRSEAPLQMLASHLMRQSSHEEAIDPKQRLAVCLSSASCFGRQTWRLFHTTTVTVWFIFLQCKSLDS